MARLPDASSLGPRRAPQPQAGVASIDTSSFGAERKLGEVAMAAAADWQRQVAIETERANRVRAEDALNKLLEVDQDLSIGPENGFTRFQGGDAVTRPLAKEYTEKFTEKRKAIASGLGNDEQREIFERRARLVDRQFKGKVLGHIQKEGLIYEKQVLSGAESAAITNAANNYASDDAVDTYLERFNFIRDEHGRKEGEPQNVIDQAKAAVRDKVWASRLTAEAAQNPVAAYARLQLNQDKMSQGMYDRLEGGLFQASDDLLAIRAQAGLPKVEAQVAPAPAAGNSFDTAVSSLLKREGGYNASDGKSGAPVNFGINQRANPDIDVKGLTRERAVELYRERYWKAIGGDNLPPATALVALDAAALQGVGVAKKLISETNGDPAQMIARRREQLQALADGDPEHRKNLSTWMRRLDGLQAEVGTLNTAAQAAPAVALATLTVADAANLKTGDPLIDNLPPHRKLAVIQKAQTQARQESAQMRDGVQGRFVDSVAALERGIESTNAPSQAELVLAFGQVDGTRRARELNEARRFGLDVKAVATMSPAEQAGLVAARQPREGDGAEVFRRNDQLLTAIERTNRARADDPAAFAIQYAPPVQRAFQNMNAAAPEARAGAAQAFADATIAEQRRLGVAEPKVLPKSMADQIVREFVTPAEGGQGPAQFVQAQAAMWGKHWPAVYQQIAKDIGPSARVVANLRDAPAAAQLSMNAKMQTADLRKQIASPDAKALDEKVEAELEPFRKSLVGWTTGGAGAYNDFDEQAKRLAYIYASQGTKPVEAAKRAAQELVGEYYEFRGATRIPKAVDANVAEAGMAATLRNAEALNVRMPEGSAKTLGADFTAKQIAASLKSKGFFITLGDESGVALFLEGANGARAVEGADGKPVTFTWRELEDRAVAARRDPKVTQFGDTSGGAATGVRRAR